MKILLLDIETSPNTAYVWNLFKETIPLARLIETSDVLCWSAKWLGSDSIIFDSVNKSTHEDMLAHIHMLLDEADAVIHYNGLRFDIPVLNKEFLLCGFTPPAPYKNIDLFRTVKNVFKFTSNKLDHVVQQLGLGEKVDTTFDLWINCMNNDPKSWEHMEAYNKQDVLLLEKLYFALRAWIPNHPNYTLYNETEQVLCPVCGSAHHRKEGFAYTTVGKYQRYSCKGCGRWFRGRENLGGRTSVNIV